MGMAAPETTGFPTSDPGLMKTHMLFKTLAVVAALPLAALAENPDTSSTSKAGTSASAEKMEAKPQTPIKDGIVRKTDAVYIYKAGEPTKVEAKMVAFEGVTVEPNGRVVWASGKEIMLGEGEKVAFDGTLLKEPKAASPDRNAMQGTSGARD